MFNLEFLLTSLVVVLIPGTGVIYTVSTGLTRGRRVSLAAAVGSTLGCVPHLVCAVLGLSAVMHRCAVAYECMRWAGVVYLMYMAWGMWRESGTLSFGEQKQEMSQFKTVWRGVMLNLLNPKLTIFFLAFLPQFIDSSVGATGQMLELSGIFMGMTLVVFVCYGLLAVRVREHIIGSQKAMQWMRRSFAVVFAWLGIRLAMEKR